MNAGLKGFDVYHKISNNYRLMSEMGRSEEFMHQKLLSKLVPDDLFDKTES